jgi:hypothetical protein
MDTNVTESWSGESNDEAANPAGEIRIRPVHAFGLRTAALAGLVVTTASVAVVASPLAALAMGTAPCCVSGP